MSDTLHCADGGKSQHGAAKVIAGPTVFICDECGKVQWVSFVV